MRRRHPFLNFFAIAMAFMMMAVTAMAYVPIAQECEDGCGCCDDGKHCPCLTEMPEQSPVVLLDHTSFHVLELALPADQPMSLVQCLESADLLCEIGCNAAPPGNLRWRALLSSWLL
jgi:hypothetical protein